MQGAQVQSRRSNQSILKEINPEYSLEGLMLKLKLQYFGHLMQRANSLENPDAGKDWGREEKGTTEDEMVGWHDWHNGHGLGWTLGIGDGQGGLVSCGSWSQSRTPLSNWIELNWTPWKKSYDQSRQHTKKQRHYFADKGPSSQSYGFSSSHVWMRIGPERKLSVEELMILNCGVGEDSWKSLGLQGDPISPS